MDAFDKLCSDFTKPAPAVAHWCPVCEVIAEEPSLVTHAAGCTNRGRTMEVLQFDEVTRRGRRVISGAKAVARWRGANYFLLSSTWDATQPYRGRRLRRRASDYNDHYYDDDLYFASDGQFW